MTKTSYLATKDIENFKKYILQKPRILVLTHAMPDPDAIGSASGLYMGLGSLGLAVHVACKDEVPEDLRLTNAWKDFITDFDPQDYDCVFFTDCGDRTRTFFQDTYPEILNDKMVKVNLDHHASNDLFGEINFVSTEAASACELVHELLQNLQVDITPDIATALLMGIYGDTGAFHHSNTQPATYRTAATLVNHGAQIQRIAKNIFQTYKFRTLKLWGKILEDLHLTDDGAAILGVEKKIYEDMGASRDDIKGIIDYINSMPEAKYSVLLTEDEKGNVKASLRTSKPDIDVKALAEKFGGGGHVKASGFMVKHSKLQKEVKWKIVTDDSEQIG